MLQREPTRLVGLRPEWAAGRSRLTRGRDPQCRRLRFEPLENRTLLTGADVGPQPIAIAAAEPSPADSAYVAADYAALSSEESTDSTSTGSATADPTPAAYADAYFGELAVRAVSARPPTISNVPAQTAVAGVPTAAIPFTVGDADTPLADLTVTATSTDETLVPEGSIQILGSGAERTLVITPAPGAGGDVVVMLSVSDGTQQTPESFYLEISPSSIGPSISAIADQATLEDTAMSPVVFTLADPDTSSELLTVVLTSSNETLVPLANIQISGSGADCTLSLVPAENQYGSSQITLVVSDGEHSAVETFTLVVAPVNDPPAISPIADQAAIAGQAAGTVSFTIADLETPADSLMLTAVSSDTQLLPDSAIELGGSGTDRTLTITPPPGHSGVVWITVTVADLSGGGLAGHSDVTFSLTISPPPESAAADSSLSVRDEGRASLPSPQPVLAVAWPAIDETLPAGPEMLAAGDASLFQHVLQQVYQEFGEAPADPGRPPGPGLLVVLPRPVVMELFRQPELLLTGLAESSLTATALVDAFEAGDLAPPPTRGSLSALAGGALVAPQAPEPDAPAVASIGWVGLWWTTLLPLSLLAWSCLFWLWRRNRTAASRFSPLAAADRIVLHGSNAASIPLDDLHPPWREPARQQH